MDTLTQVAMSGSERDTAILLEAIRAKNDLVLERFRIAYAACQGIVELALQVDADLESFRSTVAQTDGSVTATRRFVGSLETEFHPKHYRQLNKLRGRFESTCDLFSAYSFVFVELVHFPFFEGVADKKGLRKPSDLLRLYRGLWTLYSELLIRLVRLTSNDLRFWLTDVPYVHLAEDWAERDLALAKDFLHASDWGGKKFHISLETASGLSGFWDAVTAQDSPKLPAVQSKRR